MIQPKSLGFGGIGLDFDENGTFRQIGQIVRRMGVEVVEAQKLRKGPEVQVVPVFDDAARLVREGAQAGDAGEDLTAAVVDDDDADLQLGELRDDPRPGEVIQSTEVTAAASAPIACTAKSG